MKFLKFTLASLMMTLLATLAVSAQVNVTATAGTTPATYTTLTDAFNAVNAGTHQGNVTIALTGNTTEPANTSAVLNSSGAGAALYTSVLVYPGIDGVTVTGTGGTGTACGGKGLIELNGADNVTIDGDNPNSGGTNRNLTVTSTCIGTFHSVIRIALATTIVTSADNNTIKNLNLNSTAAAGRNVAAESGTTSLAFNTFGILAGAGASTVAATTAPGTVTATTTTIGAGATATNLTIDNNNIQSVGRAVSINGAATSVFPGLLISNNLIGNATAADATQVYTVGITAQGSTNGSIRDNTVYVEGFIASTTGGSNTGIGVGDLSANAVFTIERNRVNRVKSNSTTGFNARGINVAATPAQIVRNNFVSGVSNIGASTFDGTFGAFGIRLNAGTGHQIYHNSVNMNGNLGGTGAALTAAFGITATTVTGVDARNNIFANTQTETAATTPASSAFVSVFLPSATLTSAFNLTLNNNAYYQGAATNSGIGQAGTTAGTGFFRAANFDPTATTPATNFRAYTSTLSAAGTNDNASFASATAAPFTSSTDLHIPAGTATRLESGGAAVGVTTDIDQEARPNGTAPDIGADEFAGTAPLANDIAATAIVVPANGSTVATGTLANPQATFTNVGTAAQTNVQVQLTITGPGGFTYTDTQTIATIAVNQTVTVNFAPTLAFTTAGTYTTTATILTADGNATNNTVTGTFTAVAPVAGGTVNVGAGQSYTSLTNTGGLFAQLNAAGASGSIIINLTSDLTGETGSVALGQLASGINVTIKPSGAPRTITSTATAFDVLAFVGADNVTIDGSLNGGTDRSLTLVQANTTSSGTDVIFIGSQGVGAGSTNITIKNTVIRGGGTNSAGAVTTFGIFVGDQTGAANGADNDNLTIQNNSIVGARIGIQAVGVATTGLNDNLAITDNSFGGTGTATDFIGQIGLNVGQVNNGTIRRNGVRNIFNSAASDVQGIIVGLGATNTSVTRNIVSNLEASNTGGYGSTGISIATGAAASNITVANNFVFDIRGTSYLASILTDTNAGIRVVTTGTGGVNIYFNSVNLFGSYAGFNGATISSPLLIGAGVTGLDIRDNALVNTSNNTTVTTDKNYAFYSASANTAFTVINYNDYFNAAAPLGAVNAVDAADITAFRTATGQDVNSLNVDPLFVSNTNPHLQSTSPLIDAGVQTLFDSALVPVLEDFDGSARPSGAAPDIGGDEVTPTAASVTIGGRVLTAEGRGVVNATVYLTDQNGVSRRVQTRPFGYYSFPDVGAGQTVTVQVASKRFTFAPQSINVTESIDNLNFVSGAGAPKTGD